MSKIEVNAVEPQCGTTLTLGASGDTVDLSNASVTLPSGIQAVSWQTGSIKTSGFTAAAGEGYFCNTSSSAFTVTLPSGSAGAVVAVSDYTRTFQTNNLTVAPQSGEKIGGIAADAILSTEGQTATFVYVDSTEGWINVQETSNSVIGNPFLVATGGTITTCGNFKIHTFTGPGTFTVCKVSCTAAENTVGYLVIAGGGAGGANRGGGGGAGGFREGRNVPIDNFTASPLVANAPTNAVTVTAQAYPITVGGGGTGVTYPAIANSGSNSTFATITSAGGGGGGGAFTNNPPAPQGGGTTGGSGGGGSGWDNNIGTGAAGNTPPVSPSQGSSGGNGGDANPGGSGGGGGGATAPGATGSGNSGGNGGAGATTSINGTPTGRSGGGGGGPWNQPNTTASDGGGAGVPTLGSCSSNPGTANTGGGGGAGYPTSGNGGSGIVIIRYKYQ